MSLDVLADRAAKASMENFGGVPPCVSCGDTMASITYCLVCGDRASGRHYGVLTCDGCRGFFKRSVRRNIGYACKFQGTCIVDVKRRNQCQACRFQRCVTVGMNRHAVQHERIPRRSKKGPKEEMGANRQHTERPRAPLSNQTNVQRDEKPTLARCNNNNIIANSTPTQQKSHETTERKRKSAYSIESLLEVANKERVKFSSSPMTPPNTPPASPPVQTSLPSNERNHESVVYMLHNSISWAQNMPSFLELPANDKALLLQEGWIEQFLLTATQYDFPNELLTAFISQRLGSNIAQTQWKYMETTEIILGRLKAMQLDATEIAYLKAIALLKPHIHGISSQNYIETVQDGVQVMLSEYMKNKYGVSNSTSKFGKAILSLPLVQNLNRDIFNMAFYNIQSTGLYSNASSEQIRNQQNMLNFRA